MTPPTEESEVGERGFRMLPWDSDRFGFPVARIVSLQNPAKLPGMLNEMRRLRIGLVYLSVPAHDPVLSASLLAECNGRLVDSRITYVADLAGIASSEQTRAPNREPLIVEYPKGDVEDSLLLLARESGIFSRFRVDPRINPAVFESIYDAWIRRSAQREIADEVYVHRHGDGIAGFVTVGTRGNRSDIGLLAVGEQFRGRGVGGALVRRAHSWARSRGLLLAQVVTQRANRAACDLYESAGYAIESIEHVYHFWLDPE